MAGKEYDLRILDLIVNYHKLLEGDRPASHHLLFDRVNERKPPHSTAILFIIQCEILSDVIEYLDTKSLAVLALANRDCRQLARSRQFSIVLFDYSDSSVGLIKKLLSEGKKREQSLHGTASHPSIGACIRRITVVTNREFISKRHGISFKHVIRQGIFEYTPQAAQMRQAVTEVSRAFFTGYASDLQSVFLNRKILPHLERLDWAKNSHI